MIPADINIDSLWGPIRGKHPAIFLLDDHISWNANHESFILIYTIFEHGMMNPLGCIAWGRRIDGKHKIIKNPPIYVSCGGRQICAWVSTDTFIIKAHVYHPKRVKGQKVRVPLVAINLGKGFQIIKDTDNNESYPNESTLIGDAFTEFHKNNLIASIKIQP